MGEFINFISGITEDMLPIGPIGGILGNTPDILKSEKNYEKTKELYEKSNADYLMVDSGGFQMHLINEDNLKLLDPADMVDKM